MNYEEKITLLNGDDFFSLFEVLRAEPCWVNSAGKRAIQLIGLCHHGKSHSALFDPTTLKVNCFSECGGGMLLHTWVKRVLGYDDPQQAKDFIEDWIDGKNIDLSNRTPINADFGYTERPFKLEHIEPVKGIDESVIRRLYDTFDDSEETLSRLVWHTKEGIDVVTLKLYQVAYHPEHHTIILPHHNVNGEIVGLYERSFLMTRREFRKKYPDVDYKETLKLPRAKYVPLLRDEFYREMLPDEEKTSWSFPNSQNLYGLHIAKPYIEKTGEAIIFEGAKSVMLAHQWGYPNAVASHTFGCHVNHINMLYECGARTIYLAFDKQYEVQDEDDKEWMLYQKKTKGIAARIKDVGGIIIKRIIDLPNTGVVLDKKDAPVDKGKEKFETLFAAAKQSPPLWPDPDEDKGEVPEIDAEHQKRNAASQNPEILAFLAKRRQCIDNFNKRTAANR